MFKSLFGFSQTTPNIGFEDVKYAIHYIESYTPYSTHNTKYILINTLPETEQDVLIFGTTPASKEEEVINQLIKKTQMNTHIIIYGKNNTDITPIAKYNELIRWGFQNVQIYNSGIFEWALLQDVYGETEFPTTSKIKDILKYRSHLRIEE